MPWTKQFPNGSAYVASQSSPEAGFGGAYLDMAPEQMPGFPAIGPKRPSWLRRILTGIKIGVAVPLAACTPVAPIAVTTPAIGWRPSLMAHKPKSFPKPPKLLVPAFLFSLAIPLGACTSDNQPVVEYRLVDPSVPKALRSCAGAPAVPGAKGTQRDVAHYVVNLRSAHNDCKSKLNAVDGILNDTEQAVAKQNAPAAK